MAFPTTIHIVSTMTDRQMTETLDTKMHDMDLRFRDVVQLNQEPREYNADEVLTHFGLADTVPLEAIILEDINSEADPSGLSSKDPGSKLDAGKVDVNLLWESFPRALLAVAEVATYGAAKYTRGGWKEVEGGIIRYGSAEGRHKLNRNAGEVYDSGPKGSQLPHRYHEAWNSLAQLELCLIKGDLS